MLSFRLTKQTSKNVVDTAFKFCSYCCIWWSSSRKYQIKLVFFNNKTFTHKQALKFASALSNCQGFCQGILGISPICLGNLIAEANFLSNIFFSYHNYCQIIMKRDYHANLFHICFCFFCCCFAFPKHMSFLHREKPDLVSF